MVSETIPALVVPSPHINEHVCGSSVPASVKFAFRVTAEPTIKGTVGPVMLEITGFMFATVTLVLPLAFAPILSVTPTEMVYVSGGVAPERLSRY